MLEGRHSMSISQINVKSTSFETCLKKTSKQGVQLIKRWEISMQDGTRIWLVRSWGWGWGWDRTKDMEEAESGLAPKPTAL